LAKYSHRRNFHGLDFVLGYTYSHAIDDLSSNWVAFLPMDSGGPRLTEATATATSATASLFVTYTLPEHKTKSQLSKAGSST